MSTTAAEQAAMRRALELAATPGVPLGPNPRVGCVLLADDGSTVAEGFHRGAGTPHAEADALARAGDRARGTTAVVTLEPCNHTGRTAPCAQALIAAGVRRVVFAQSDPNPAAAGGADTLRAAGIEVESGLMTVESRLLNTVWTFAVEHGRPFVTWKFATTLDGRSAAADGTSRWVSSLASRRDTHRLRALCDVMLVGTNTVAVDDPLLTVRDDQDQPLPVQPLRAVMGERDLDPGRRLFNSDADSVHLRTRDPREALAELYARDRQHVFLEGGPTLAAAFLHADLVDEIVVYVAPMLLGAGRSAVADLGITTIADAFRPRVTDITVLDGDPDGNVRFTLTPERH
ncbi:bifunctional diaminohydroxyphosphoribosylaminopyrimidine deaminase/5-amino-6-(5-phosphoribosylamino)uracil reductase [Nocardioides sp. Root1257]|uniref:bifunctional diaminohydroxyphosphoribosylaminopyrimidine deaminase/5-amino-6-(5-phosphoribosylamino)uracil reductase RibD n=1 Tax=unclassified Nocardioides TaxID=2615069 RepID=UPI000701B07D|nr:MULTISPECIES: bifunctional diaminohydroxyphosphoribosylaminopyrimidine deaminase/5-amino-6-(5-phosphoribosylamino)uracil reductase RibD [unclassified Nocardioides]KQW43096.1 bifunctional diaminohydroxyphosphoribosylaminopyrimidine deaminase/5-amino-6-(5-phosphoribosylamino)uracil reductase [Nocardioides sp. Root1257]KRC41964.1 bifunctional diaminohydroxyphosphoribosylaminopyrimidine deaminase/5-amino-6-(5-phosphoribosylamino)uracil reductase [Nocardioides sp. Root224]